jgi:hypothetical protein
MEPGWSFTQGKIENAHLPISALPFRQKAKFNLCNTEVVKLTLASPLAMPSTISFPGNSDKRGSIHISIKIHQSNVQIETWPHFCVLFFFCSPVRVILKFHKNHVQFISSSQFLNKTTQKEISSQRSKMSKK